MSCEFHSRPCKRVAVLASARDSNSALWNKFDHVGYRIDARLALSTDSALHSLTRHSPFSFRFSTSNHRIDHGLKKVATVALWIATAYSRVLHLPYGEGLLLLSLKHSAFLIFHSHIFEPGVKFSERTLSQKRFRRHLCPVECVSVEQRGVIRFGRFKAIARRHSHHGAFLLHYLDAVVYPNIPPNLLVLGAVAVCSLNLWIYTRRVHVRHSPGR